MDIHVYIILYIYDTVPCSVCVGVCACVFIMHCKMQVQCINMYYIYYTYTCILHVYRLKG